ncbi:cyclin-H-like [Varroa jacobsoni]|uniref:Cyclin-H n=1 Tax=Varroa destructor TaxID=109461 RepID=A0A7M7MCJ5_VARDE|nr:cyclin-H-like [Varroa destructor]XP_022702262.1 cyclin-H-like [Varroa jacobsoni]
MFSHSTQRKYWMFCSERELANLREASNTNYIQNTIARDGRPSTEDIYDTYLLPSEERMLYRHYEFLLREFCKKFQPPVPKAVMGTSLAYFKRFYLRNSVMDLHPKHMIVTCVYLACKVEEFNVSITQFVNNVKGDREKAQDVILSNELLLMQHLRYHLTVHNPYRPVEGLLIDIKTRMQHIIQDAENLRPLMDDFLDRSLLTDASLLFAPSQIALAGVVYAVNKAQFDCNEYLNILFQDAPPEKLAHARRICKEMHQMIKAIDMPAKEQVKQIEKKLEKCRNQENNPDSTAYKRKMEAEEERSNKQGRFEDMDE